MVAKVAMIVRLDIKDLDYFSYIGTSLHSSYGNGQLVAQYSLARHKNLVLGGIGIDDQGIKTKIFFQFIKLNHTTRRMGC